MNDTAHNETGRHHRSVPQGYRQGLITAITVLLGFSLTFLRYWNLPNHSLNRTARPAALARRPLDPSRLLSAICDGGFTP